MEIQYCPALLPSHLSEQGDVGDGQPEGVNLGESLFVGEGRHVTPQLLEGGVDGGAAEREALKAGTLYICSCLLKLITFVNRPRPSAL